MTSVDSHSHCLELLDSSDAVLPINNQLINKLPLSDSVNNSDKFMQTRSLNKVMHKNSV